MSTLRLWLVRHARPLVQAGTCYGALDVAADSPQTQAAAAALAAGLPPGATLHTSPLKRCGQLARALCAMRADLHSEPDPRLAEMNFGDWEGRLWADIGKDAMDAWTADFPNHRPGNGESVGDFMQRVAAAFDEVRAQGRDAVWITHAGVIRAAHLISKGRRHVTSADQWPATATEFGAWKVIEL